MKESLERKSAKEIRWLASHKCTHRHTFINHPRCYNGLWKERIGFLDIETEALNADYGIIFSYCIKDNDSKKIYEDAITKDDIRKWGKVAQEDTRLLRNLVRDMSNFDRLVGHFSSLFDLPFIRTRAVMCKVGYPEYGVYCQSDTWRILKTKFKLSRNSLESGTRNLLGKTRKNHLSLKLKHGCLRGDRKSIEETLVHNRRDVLDTQDLFHITFPFTKFNKSSI